MTAFRPKVQIVSRYIPAENRSGHFTYLLDFMRYLRSARCQVELVALNPLFEEDTIPAEVLNIADVQVRSLPQKAEETSQPQGTVSKLKALFRPYYMRLPEQYVHAVRKMYYRLRGMPIYETRNWDAQPCLEEMQFTAERIIAFQPDVVIANYTFLSDVLDVVPEASRVLTAILTWDIRYQRFADYQHAGYQNADSVWSKESEANLLRKADILLAIQKEDATALQEMAPECEILCAPMSARLSPTPYAQIPGRCMFVGSNVDHNVYGIQWFLNDVWPLVLAEVPTASLSICGSVCKAVQADVPNMRLVQSHGPWEEEYSAAEVCLIPLVVGSGLKIKLVEALSHGRACVSTSVGIQGVRELSDRAVLVADAPEQFARAVLAVLKNPKHRERMEEYARNYIIENLSPEKAYQPVVDRIYHHAKQ